MQGLTESSHEAISRMMIMITVLDSSASKATGPSCSEHQKLQGLVVQSIKNYRAQSFRASKLQGPVVQSIKNYRAQMFRALKTTGFSCSEH